MVRNFRDLDKDRITVVIFDSTGKPRTWTDQRVRLNAGVPFYNGDTVKVLYQHGCIGASNICDVITVNPSTGAESVASTKAFTTPLQKGLVLKCTAINAGSGVATLTTTYEVF